MAVEASHINILSPQLIQNRDSVYANQGNVLGYNNAQIGSIEQGRGITWAAAMAEGILPFHQSLLCDSLQPKTSMNTDSGLTYNVTAPRKRTRDSFEQFNTPPTNFSSFVGDQILPQIRQYQSDIDNIISQHSKKLRLELEERQKQQARLLVAGIGEGVMKKLKEKDEQIQKMGKWNLALQERVKSLYAENQLWRDLAQTNEAAANSLRTNLEQVLAHVSNDPFFIGGVGGAQVVEDDAESCCGSSDYGREGEKQAEGERILAGEAQGGVRMLAPEVHDKKYGKNNSSRMCRKCLERKSCVLLLPCRHLCLCTVCGSTLLQTCPVCNSNMNATVHVNLAS